MAPRACNAAVFWLAMAACNCALAASIRACRPPKSHKRQSILSDCRVVLAMTSVSVRKDCGPVTRSRCCSVTACAWGQYWLRACPSAAACCAIWLQLARMSGLWQSARSMARANGSGGGVRCADTLPAPCSAVAATPAAISSRLKWLGRSAQAIGTTG